VVTAYETFNRQAAEYKKTKQLSLKSVLLHLAGTQKKYRD